MLLWIVGGANIVAGRFVFKGGGIMAEIHKLSVEKTLNKIRGDDAKQSKEAAFNARLMCSMRK